MAGDLYASGSSNTPLSLVFPYFPVFSLKINKNIPSGSSLRTEFALQVK